MFQYHFVEETGFSLLDYIGSFVKKQMIVNLQVYFWALCSAPLVCLSVSDTVLISVALFYVLKSSNVNPPTLLSFIKIALATLDSYISYTF